MQVKTKSIYDEAAPDDGRRILVMRYWPRGVRKDAVDAWAKDLGTPAELIKGWKHGSVTWKEFTRRYRNAMYEQREKIADMAKQARRENVTLLCSCHDEAHCHRTLLKELIEKARPGTD